MYIFERKFVEGTSNLLSCKELEQIKLYSNQLVVEALSIMREHKLNRLPVFQGDGLIGEISYEELMRFLNRYENGKNTYFHKLNFDMVSALTVIRGRQNRIRRKNLRLALAAIITTSLLSVAWLFFNQTQMAPEQEVASIVPGSNKAMLTLADGSIINLSEVKNGVLVNDIGFEVIKTNDGQIIYKIRDVKNSSGKVTYNTITTPKGGQFQVLLADGTKIWLNAASTIKFPATFAALSSREVSLNGEAYFEVAKDKAHPFLLSAKGQKIEVLGTHFNVSAYKDEISVKTTLLEGSVKLSPVAAAAGKNKLWQPQILKPNQRATLTGAVMAIKEVDTEEDVAWKNGDFFFRKESLENVMRKVARWYDVEVVYETKPSDAKIFGGLLSRSEHIDDLLNTLEMIGNVHFKIEGRRVIVKK